MKVITKILIIICCFLFAIEGEAQIGLKRRVFTDFRGGINTSEMDIEDGNINKKAKIGFHVGVAVSYKFYNDFQLQSGAFLTKKGMKQKLVNQEIGSGESGAFRRVRNATVTTDANYIQVPLMIGLESDETKQVIFNINGGVYGAWGFKGESKMRGTDTVYEGSAATTQHVSEKWTTFSSSYLKKFDYGLMGSVGVVYEIYTFNISYEYGLYNVSNDDEVNLKNRNLTFAVGFRF